MANAVHIAIGGDRVVIRLALLSCRLKIGAGAGKVGKKTPWPHAGHASPRSVIGFLGRMDGFLQVPSPLVVGGLFRFQLRFAPQGFEGFMFFLFHIRFVV